MPRAVQGVGIPRTDEPAVDSHAARQAVTPPNGQDPLTEALADCFRPDVWQSWGQAADAHCAALASMSDLADNLADFCVSQLHSR